MNRRGFTLIEVVIALAIAATAFVSIASVLRGGTRQHADAAGREHISVALAAKLSEILCKQESATQGTLARGVRWTVYKTPVLVADAQDLIRYEIVSDADPRIRFHAVVYEDVGR